MCVCVCVCVCAKREIKTNNAKKQNLFKMKKTISLIIHKTNQTCRTLLEKQGRTHKRCTLMDPHTWPCKSRTTSTNIHSATM